MDNDPFLLNEIITVLFRAIDQWKCRCYGEIYFNAKTNFCDHVMSNIQFLKRTIKKVEKRVDEINY